MAHPLPIQSWNVILPWVVSAVKLGAALLIRSAIMCLRQLRVGEGPGGRPIGTIENCPDGSDAPQAGRLRLSRRPGRSRRDAGMECGRGGGDAMKSRLTRVLFACTVAHGSGFTRLRYWLAADRKSRSTPRGLRSTRRFCLSFMPKDTPDHGGGEHRGESLRRNEVQDPWQ